MDGRRLIPVKPGPERGRRLPAMFLHVERIVWLGQHVAAARPAPLKRGDNQKPAVGARAELDVIAANNTPGAFGSHPSVSSALPVWFAPATTPTPAAEPRQVSEEKAADLTATDRTTLRRVYRKFDPSYLQEAVDALQL